MANGFRTNNRMTLNIPPITRGTLALFAGGSGDHNALHIDLDAAKAAGMPDVFAHGMLSMAYLGRLLTDNFDIRDIRRFKVRFSAITDVGDAVECSCVPTVGASGGIGTFALETRTNEEKITLVGEVDVKL